MDKFIDLDFETRSSVDLKKHGAWVYSEHPSTKVLILRWSTDEGKTYHKWWFNDKPPKQLFRKLKQGYKIRAFNSFFEFVIWTNCCVPKLGWPKLNIRDFMCVQAESNAKTFPGSLEAAAITMELLDQKDKEGMRLINKFSRPSRKAGQEWNEPKDDMADFIKFDKYCEQDVRTQIGVHENTGPLENDFEKEVFWLTEKMNVQGVPIDVPMLEGALALADRAQVALNERMKDITGESFSLTQTAKLKEWLEENGCPLPNMQAKTIERKLKVKKLDPVCREVLALRSSASKTSVSKYKSAANLIGSDGFVHGILKYHIARTGRWGGRGLQVQNFSRPKLAKWVDYNHLAELIVDEEYDLIEIIYGDVMEALSSALRSMIKATKGKKLIAADYAQIEARIVFWLADEQKALNIFRNNEDIYCDMASDVYGFKVTKANDFERFIGKQCILGLGFGMGAPKFKKDLFDKGDVVVEQKFADVVVKSYRKKYKKVVSLWTDINAAAIGATKYKGKRYSCTSADVSFIHDGEYLKCHLPSGRHLHYIDAKVEKVEPPTSWKSTKKIEQLTFMGVDSYTKKWVRLSTYGGSLLENIAQAIARDLMCYGMLEAEDEGYNMLFTVHDEGIAMVDIDFGSVPEFEEILARTPDWAKGVPVVAEGWEGPRYRK